MENGKKVEEKRERQKRVKKHERTANLNPRERQERQEEPAENKIIYVNAKIEIYIYNYLNTNRYNKYGTI
jgi:hypothetical protein